MLHCAVIAGKGDCDTFRWNFCNIRAGPRSAGLSSAMSCAGVHVVGDTCIFSCSTLRTCNQPIIPIQSSTTISVSLSSISHPSISGGSLSLLDNSCPSIYDHRGANRRRTCVRTRTKNQDDIKTGHFLWRRGGLIGRHNSDPAPYWSEKRFFPFALIEHMQEERPPAHEAPIKSITTSRWKSDVSEPCSVG
jgi:hypothetical protein